MSDMPLDCHALPKYHAEQLESGEADFAGKFLSGSSPACTAAGCLFTANTADELSEQLIAAAAACRCPLC